MSDRYRVQVCTSSNQADEKLLRPSGNDGITRGAVFQTVHLLAAIEQLQPLNFINFEWPAPLPWRTCTLQEDDPPSSGESTSPPRRIPTRAPSPTPDNARRAQSSRPCLAPRA